MKPILLDDLVCPDCRLELRCPAEQREGDDIVAGTLGQYGFRHNHLQVLDVSRRNRNSWRGHGRVGAA